MSWRRAGLAWWRTARRPGGRVAPTLPGSGAASSSSSARLGLEAEAAAGRSSPASSSGQVAWTSPAWPSPVPSTSAVVAWPAAARPSSAFPTPPNAAWLPAARPSPWPPAAATPTRPWPTPSSSALTRPAPAPGPRPFSTTPTTPNPPNPAALVDILAFATRPAWETGVTPAAAASTLSSFFGTTIRPGDVVDAPVDALTALLEQTDTSAGKAGDPTLDAALFTHADGITRRFFGEAVYLRGIVEFSNVCVNDCGYCGIRRHQPGIHRYTMPVAEVIECGRWAHAHGMGTLMLQSGELPTASRMQYLLDVVRGVREATVAMDLEKLAAAGTPPPPDPSTLGLRVALSVGEMPLRDFAALKAAGASRYLLRIETSNPALFAALHPPAQSWAARVVALRDAKRAGLQLGTGVMVGLPGQTLADLAGDLLFFKEIGADMIGMGPYITEPGTPVSAQWEAAHPPATRPAHMASMVDLTTRMNALARLTLGNVNIAATTALQAVHPAGRELALRRGANVLMPILTPPAYRADYALYEGKPCITDTAAGCEACLRARVAGVGLHIAPPNTAGDPPHAAAAAVPDVVVVGGGGEADASVPGVKAWKPPPAPLPRGGRAAVHTLAARHDTRAAVHTLAVARDRHPQRPGNQAAAHTLARPGPAPPRRPAGASRAHATTHHPPGGSDTLRTNVAFVGAMNAGKSSALCALAPGAAIVDATPGTTTDVKVALAELHGVGPVKLMDTAGVDEAGGLGAKKRRASLAALAEADVAVVVIDPTAAVGRLGGGDLGERALVDAALAAGATPLLLFNQRGGGEGFTSATHAVRDALDPDHSLATAVIDLAAPDAPTRVATAVTAAVAAHGGPPSALPALPPRYLHPGAAVLLNIPMDAETPSARLLRPQALVQEEALRHYATTIAHRMDLAAARGEAGEGAAAAERARWDAALAPLLAAVSAGHPAIVVTDSQAMDVVPGWTPESVDLTTFSIAMAHRQSGGRLAEFVAGLEAVQRLKQGDRVLVAEACNHNRITAACNDIGLVQIPAALGRVSGSEGSRGGAGGRLVLEHAWGRSLPGLVGDSATPTPRYALAVHCGGCMLDRQAMAARLRALAGAGVPVTNYGILLAAAGSGPAAVARAVAPWLKEDEDEGGRGA